MVSPTRAKADVFAADLTTHQSASASAVSGSAAERLHQVTSVFLQTFDRKEFKDLQNWAIASVEGRPYKLTLGAFEAHSIVPSEFRESLRKMAELGINPTTLKEFETALTANNISLLIS